MASRDRRAEKDVLIETIESLDADDTLARIDAVVVSGDLTNRAEQDGFDEFAQLAKTLSKHLEPRQVLVVPGNHDVAREHGPGDPQRYNEFLRVTRGLGSRRLCSTGSTSTRLGTLGRGA